MDLLELRSLYRQGRLLPFVGAGVSASVCWQGEQGEHRGPSWEELVDQAARDLGFEEPDLLRVRGTDLQILEYYKCAFSGHTKLTNWLLKSMDPPAAAIRDSAIHNELREMRSCEVIYTTNFDDFIERNFEAYGERFAIVALEQHMRTSRGTREIVKFHGDWNHPDRMVLTESEYEARMEFKTAMDLRLLSDLLNRSVLFLGYSFRDPNVAYLFRQINDRFSALPNTNNGRRAFIVVSEPSAFERRLFRERNIEVIGIPAIDRAKHIAELLQSIRS